jgi:hypothetical protein
MFFRKFREARKQARTEARIRFETQLQTALAGVDKIEKPADKLLKLEEIRQSAENKLNRENASLSEKSDYLGLAGVGGGFLGGSAAGCCAIALLALATTPATGILLGVFAVSSLLLYAGGAVGGGALGNKLVKTLINKLTARTNRDLQKIKSLSVQASKTMDTVLEKNINEILEPQSFEKIQTIPGIADKYTAAAKQAAAEAARNDEEADAPPPSTRKTGPALRT